MKLQLKYKLKLKARYIKYNNKMYCDKFQR